VESRKVERMKVERLGGQEATAPNSPRSPVKAMKMKCVGGKEATAPKSPLSPVKAMCVMKELGQLWRGHEM
jgi:hypothetical protein